MDKRNREQQRNRGLGRQQDDEQLGDYTVEQTFDPPKDAIVDGRFMKIASQGNHEGHSPAYLCWDEEGQSHIKSLEEATLVDFTAIPPTVEQVRNLLRTLK